MASKYHNDMNSTQMLTGSIENKKGKRSMVERTTKATRTSKSDGELNDNKAVAHRLTFALDPPAVDNNVCVVLYLERS